MEGRRSRQSRPEVGRGRGKSAPGRTSPTTIRRAAASPADRTGEASAFGARLRSFEAPELGAGGWSRALPRGYRAADGIEEPRGGAAFARRSPRRVPSSKRDRTVFGGCDREGDGFRGTGQRRLRAYRDRHGRDAVERRLRAIGARGVRVGGRPPTGERTEGSGRLPLPADRAGRAPAADATGSRPVRNRDTREAGERCGQECGVTPAQGSRASCPTPVRVRLGATSSAGESAACRGLRSLRADRSGPLGTGASEVDRGPSGVVHGASAPVAEPPGCGSR